MVDAAEVAFVAIFLASDKAWAVSGELVAASGGAGGRYIIEQTKQAEGRVTSGGDLGWSRGAAARR
jgi:hypothetical protein